MWMRDAASRSWPVTPITAICVAWRWKYSFGVFTMLVISLRSLFSRFHELRGRTNLSRCPIHVIAEIGTIPADWTDPVTDDDEVLPQHRVFGEEWISLQPFNNLRIQKVHPLAQREALRLQSNLVDEVDALSH